MINFQNVSKKFGRLNALKDVTLSLPHGHCIASVGPNGCGKTTLIKSILNMVVPDRGEIFFDGMSIGKDVRYRHKIGYMPQIGRYPEHMSVGQVIDMVRQIRNYKGKEDDDLIKVYALEKLLDKKMRTLSGGTTQKVSAILAFLFNPEVLILDEPTAGLDPIAAENLKNKIMHEKGKGKLILITSHLLSELDDIVTQLVFMQDGEIKVHENINTIKNITGQNTLSKAITYMLKSGQYVQDCEICHAGYS